MPVIIDGHNLLHAIQKSHEEFESITAVGLCQIINKYLKSNNECGEIVFDGTGPRDKTGFDNRSNLEVVFAGLSSDADTVIENKIKVNTAPKRLTVVSSDRRVRSAAKARMATSFKSLFFWEKIQKWSMRKRAFKEPQAKKNGLTESETKKWLEFFGLIQ
jgi:predicted RNA-binding protein with PIN domain